MWSYKLDEFGKSLLGYLGCDWDWLPTDHNPVTRALRDNPNLVNELEIQPWFNANKCRFAMSKVATICQMVVYDNGGGPDGDGKPKGLRRQWYAWYKTDFAQFLSRQLGEEAFDGTLWARRMSQTYAAFVDEMSVTYRDLWVDDASRMMEAYWDTLFRGCHIILAVEKDSLFADFKAAAKALGAKSLVSGKGKQSKAATEKLLREHFGWTDYHDPFTANEPLIVLHISDHDYDGEAVIGPTFSIQPQRYTDHVLEARVGIKPDSIDRNDWSDKWYDVKTTNSGYINWSEEKALFMAECINCGHTWPEQSVNLTCPKCGYLDVLTIKIGKEIVNQPYGFEIEAMPTRFYYRLIVNALLEVLPFDYIVKKLREECTADAYQAACDLKEEICEQNESYQALLREFERLEEIKADFEDRVEDEIRGLGEPHTKDWEDSDPDPEPEDYEQWVHDANEWTDPWRPFSRQDRTDSLVKFIKKNYDDIIGDFVNESIKF